VEKRAKQHYLKDEMGREVAPVESWEIWGVREKFQAKEQNKLDMGTCVRGWLQWSSNSQDKSIPLQSVV
jgi:hypothetical protein